jgi:hypothetical protein
MLKRKKQMKLSHRVPIADPFKTEMSLDERIDEELRLAATYARAHDRESVFWLINSFYGIPRDVLIARFEALGGQMLNPGDVTPKRARVENLVAALADERIKTLEGLAGSKGW